MIRPEMLRSEMYGWRIVALVFAALLVVGSTAAAWATLHDGQRIVDPQQRLRCWEAGTPPADGPMSRIAALALALAACGYSAAPPTAVSPDQRTAFCNSTCWNNAQCTGITACERCVGGVCSGSQPLASTERTDVSGP